jgi:hypothetical protein
LRPSRGDGIQMYWIEIAGKARKQGLIIKSESSGR